MKQKVVEANITYTFELIGEAIVDPSTLDDVPDGATVVFLPDDDPEQLEANLELAIQAARDGENVYLRHVRATSVKA